MAGEFQAINLNVQNIDIDEVMECVADRLEVSQLYYIFEYTVFVHASNYHKCSV